jgi:carboxyl-terminal processing protease
MAIAVVAVLVACPVRGSEPRPVEAPPDPLLLASFDYAWERIAEAHPYEDMKGLDWQAVRETHRPRAEVARTVKEVRRVISGMLSELGESHYAVFPAAVEGPIEVDPVELEPSAAGSSKPSPEASSEPSATTSNRSEPESATPEAVDGTGEVGMELRLVDDSAVVSRVLAGGPAEQAGVKTGWTVTKIGSRDVEELLDALPAHVRRGPGATLVAVHRLADRLAGRPGTTVTIEAGPQDDPQPFRLVRRVMGSTARFGHFPAISVRFEEALLAEGRVGYIGFNVFMPVVSRRFGDALASHRAAGIEALIIDLRGNPGGLASMVMGLSGWLVGDRDAALGVMKMRQTELRFIVNPRARKDRFDGPVAILVDGLSASTSELFAAGLQELGRAVVIGERTAGMSLPSVIEALPDGDLLQLVTADLHTPNGTRIEGVGVIPDIRVSQDTASLLAGEDPQLDAAVAHLLQSSAPTPSPVTP